MSTLESRVGEIEVSRKRMKDILTGHKQSITWQGRKVSKKLNGATYQIRVVEFSPVNDCQVPDQNLPRRREERRRAKEAARKSAAEANLSFNQDNHAQVEASKSMVETSQAMKSTRAAIAEIDASISVARG